MSSFACGLTKEIYFFWQQSLSRFDGEQWFTITAPNTYRSNNTELLGEILLGLKVHFKLVSRKILPDASTAMVYFQN